VARHKCNLASPAYESVMRALLASVSSFRGITNPSEAAVCCRALQCCSDLLQSVEGQIRSFYPPLFWGNTYPSEAAQRCSLAVTCHSVLQCVLRICCLHFLFGLWILLRLACGVCVRVYAHTTLQYNTRRNNTATHHSTLQHAATCCNTQYVSTRSCLFHQATCDKYT